MGRKEKEMRDEGGGRGGEGGEEEEASEHLHNM